MKITDIELNEKLIKVEDDVERIYQRYFGGLVRAIEQKDKQKITDAYNKSMTTKTSEELVEQGTIQTSSLIKVHFDNPLTFYFNKLGENIYNPINKFISLSINEQAINLLVDTMNGDLNNAYILGNQEKQFISEFTPEKIKSSIHHEIAHWYDDTRNNRHLTKKIKKSSETGNYKRDFRNNESVNELTKHEIEGQIHNIYQLYLNNKDIWDTIRFDDVLEMLPSLTTIKHKLIKINQFERWKKMLLKRMAREGLLGKNMRNK